MECADVPLLTPSSKEMMSQALKATFSGFAKEQQRLGIPKGKTWLPKEKILCPPVRMLFSTSATSFGSLWVVLSCFLANQAIKLWIYRQNFSAPLANCLTDCVCLSC